MYYCYGKGGRFRPRGPTRMSRLECLRFSGCILFFRLGRKMMNEFAIFESPVSRGI